MQFLLRFIGVLHSIAAVKRAADQGPGAGKDLGLTHD